jgi:hypothetical protein
MPSRRTTSPIAAPFTAPATVSPVEAFLRLVEAETTDPAHLRLTEAVRSRDPVAALEKELGKIILELLS